MQSTGIYWRMRQDKMTPSSNELQSCHVWSTPLDKKKCLCLNVIGPIDRTRWRLSGASFLSDADTVLSSIWVDVQIGFPGIKSEEIKTEMHRRIATRAEKSSQWCLFSYFNWRPFILINQSLYELISFTKQIIRTIIREACWYIQSKQIGL